ncbi:MAG: hypothetical protein ACRCZJ_05930 [Erysipelotrichaceae bacterium]
MIDVIRCTCGKMVETKWNGKIVHVQCEDCKQRYQLDQMSRRKYLMVTPFVIALLLILNRAVFNITDIALLTLYILGGSYFLAHGLNVAFVKQHIFSYEQKSNNQ